jgi:hypothetical protein
VVTSPIEFDHQEPSPWFGPTANDPAPGSNLQVPSIWAIELIARNTMTDKK